MRNAAILPTVIPPLVYEFRAGLIQSLETANNPASERGDLRGGAFEPGFELAKFRAPIIDTSGDRSPFLSMHEENENLPAELVKEIRRLDDDLDLPLHWRMRINRDIISTKRFDKALKKLKRITESGRWDSLTTRMILRSKESMSASEFDALKVVAGEVAAGAEKLSAYAGRHKVQFLSGLMYASLPAGEGVPQATSLFASSAQLFLDNGYHMTASAIFEALSSLYLRGEHMEETGIPYLTNAIDSWNFAVQLESGRELLKGIWLRSFDPFISPEEWRAIAGAMTVFLDCVDEIGVLVDFIPQLADLGALAENIADDSESDLFVLNDSLNLDPGNPYILHDRGMVRVAAGDMEGGVKDLFQASARLHKHPEYLGDLGDAYRLFAQRLYRAGEKERAEAVLHQAVDTMDKAVTQNKLDALNRLRRAITLVLSNEDEDAREDIDFALAAPATSAMAQQLQKVLEQSARAEKLR